VLDELEHSQSEMRPDPYRAPGSYVVCKNLQPVLEQPSATISERPRHGTADPIYLGRLRYAGIPGAF
jgi:hypothetical protein